MASASGSASNRNSGIGSGAARPALRATAARAPSTGRRSSPRSPPRWPGTASAAGRASGAPRGASPPSAGGTRRTRAAACRCRPRPAPGPGPGRPARGRSQPPGPRHRPALRRCGVRSSRNASASAWARTSSSSRSTAGAPVADPRGDQHVAGPEPRQQFLDLADRLLGVDVVDDQQPARMRLQPVEDLRQLLVDRGRLRRSSPARRPGSPGWPAARPASGPRRTAARCNRRRAARRTRPRPASCPRRRARGRPAGSRWRSPGRRARRAGCAGRRGMALAPLKSVPIVASGRLQGLWSGCGGSQGKRSSASSARS